MSQDNINTARRCVDALNRRDVDGYLDCCTDDVELRTAAVELEGAHVGAAGLRRFFADIADAAPDFWLEVERLEAVGPDRVLGFRARHRERTKQPRHPRGGNPLRIGIRLR